MLLLGLQKLTLLDFPGKMACTVFTCGCDFRCPFCHNAALVTGVSSAQPLPEEEFFSFLKKRQGILQGVCISGGEPTIQPDLKGFIKKIRDLGFKVKLDTNGNNPKVLAELINEGLLDYVAMDIKNGPSKYPLTAGVGGLSIDAVSESVKLLLSDVVDYEFRTTVVKEFHSEADIEEAARFIAGAKRYYLQGFIDSGNLIKSGLSGYDKHSMESLLKLTKQYVKTAELRGF